MDIFIILANIAENIWRQYLCCWFSENPHMHNMGTAHLKPGQSVSHVEKQNFHWWPMLISYLFNVFGVGTVKYRKRPVNRTWYRFGNDPLREKMMTESNDSLWATVSSMWVSYGLYHVTHFLAEAHVMFYDVFNSWSPGRWGVNLKYYTLQNHYTE